MRASLASAMIGLGLFLAQPGVSLAMMVAEPEAGQADAAKPDVVTADAAKDDAGQGDLDAAVEAKLTARNPRDLNAVITHCESAIEKGLGEKNQSFARQLMASALVERGMAISEAIFGRNPPPPQWPQLRQIAVADFERALQYDDKVVEAHALLAKLLMLPGGDRKRAAAALEELVKLTADDPRKQSEALLQRAGVQDTPEKAMADIDKSIELAPDDPKPVRVRGALKVNQKDMAGALVDFEAALKLEPEDSATLEAKGLILAAEQKWPEARAALDLAVKYAKEGPQAVTVLLQRARVNMAAGDTNAGLADFSEALRIEPENLAALVMRAEAAAEDHPDQAIEDLNKALDLRPGLVPALRQRAVLLANTKKLAGAISDLELIRKLEPKDQTAALQLAAVYTMDGKQGEAAKVYDSILQAEPKNWFALRGRADTFLNQGKQREAIADYEQALSEKPKDSGILNNLAWVLATSPDDSIRNGKRSIELATQAAEETKFQQAHILSTLAASYAESGDFAKAIEWSKKAVELGSEAMKPALAKELESYEAKKPWREDQTAASQPVKAEEPAP